VIGKDAFFRYLRLLLSELGDPFAAALAAQHRPPDSGERSCRMSVFAPRRHWRSDMAPSGASRPMILAIATRTAAWLRSPRGGGPGFEGRGGRIGGGQFGTRERRGNVVAFPGGVGVARRRSMHAW
jgi:hypothetical protein